MIRSFKHRGLKRLYERGDRNKLNPLLVKKLLWLLEDLDAATTIEHLNRPGYRLHRLKGNMSHQFAIDVSGNWRLIFSFDAGEASNLDLIDYH
ncbi:MAG: type II toxin-antitoxin system RelE/ParE family toxin [Xanthomonadales bacterium]|nr:type II toxin-antitoxin system RelE/ParE family toxin [Xanthomonadales bacterium]